MRELRQYAEPVLKITCLILAVFVVIELAGIIIRWNPFRGVTVPELPSLAAGTNAPSASGHGTNPAAIATVKGTNNPQPLAGTNAATTVIAARSNSISPSTPAANESNSIAHAEAAKAGTNLDVRLEIRTNSAPSTNAAENQTNLLISTTAARTNPAPSATGANTNSTVPKMAAEHGTNAISNVGLDVTRTNAETNVIARLETKLRGTNFALATNTAVKGTNVLASATGTNTPPVLKSDKKHTNAPPSPEMAGMNFNQPSGKRGGDLSPAMQTRINKIVDSEILGPVMRPLPMALLGIAGEFAFLRSASGQTGLVKEGDSLGELKLVRIGINRVLIEQNGQKEELMIFSGYGGDSLLPTNTPNENNHP
jgi:hypothetical protein